MSTSRRTFTASFDGECEMCDGDIQCGDDIAYLDDEVVCEECWLEGTE